MFSKQAKSKVVLLIDVQSSIVRSSLILMKRGSPPHIFTMNEWVLPHRRDGDSSRLIESTLKTIDEAVETGGRRPFLGFNPAIEFRGLRHERHPELFGALRRERAEAPGSKHEVKESVYDHVDYLLVLAVSSNIP